MTEPTILAAGATGFVQLVRGALQFPSRVSAELGDLVDRCTL